MRTTRQAASLISSARGTIREALTLYLRLASISQGPQSGLLRRMEMRQEWSTGVRPVEQVRLETCARFIPSLLVLLATQRPDDTMQRAFSFYGIFTDVVWITKDRHGGVDIMYLFF